MDNANQDEGPLKGPNKVTQKPRMFFDVVKLQRYLRQPQAMNPVIGDRDFEVVEVKTSRLYALLLRDDVANPFANRAGLPPDEARRARVLAIPVLKWRMVTCRYY